MMRWLVCRSSRPRCRSPPFARATVSCWSPPRTPQRQQAAGAASATAGAIEATVFTVGSTDSSGARTVDVVLAEDQAARVASASAAGKVAIVLVPRG